MKNKRFIILLLLIMIFLIPFKVEAKDYKIMLSYFSNRGTISSGNVEVISGVVFVKNSTKADITYSSNQTISHINSLDGTNTFTLKKGSTGQTKTKEWYALNSVTGKKIYFNNAKTYTVKQLAKMLNLDTTYSENTGNSLEVYMQANYEKYIYVKNVELNTSIMKIKKGKTSQIKAIIAPSNATNKEIKWTSEDPSIATVDSKGNVTGVKGGTTKIVATTVDGGKVAKCLVTVDSNEEIKPNKITITSYPSKMTVGDTKTLTATIIPSNATNKKVTWSSSNTKIATIDQNGKLKAIKAGTVTITAQTNNTVKTSVTITIEKKNGNYVIIKYNTNNGKLVSPHDSRITEKSGKLYLDGSDVFHKYNFSNNPKKNDLANYNNHQWINILREGYRAKPGKEWNTKPDGSGKSYDQTKQYQAKDFCTDNNKDCTVTLYVNWEKSPVTKITVDKENVTVEAGKTIAIKATADNKTSFVWTIANGDIAKVSSNGVITGLNKGKTTVKVAAKENNKVYKKITVNVTKAENTSTSRDGNVYFIKTDSRINSDALLIKSNGHYGMIDVAVKQDAKTLVKKLKKYGVKELDFVLFTHSHGDHTGAWRYIVEESGIKVKQLYLKKDSVSKKSSYSKIIKIANSKTIPICDVKYSACQNFHLGYISFKLYNTEVSYSNPYADNANSIASVANVNGKRILFAGDIGNYYNHYAEKETFKKIGNIDIYKVAHHGFHKNDNNNALADLKLIKPEYAVFTNRNADHKKNIRETRNRLLKVNSNIKLYYTGDGDVKLNINSNGKIKFTQ